MELLTEEQKKKNHIVSESRRRDNIRLQFDKLVELVPTLTPLFARSEHVIMSRTAEYIEQLRREKAELLKQKQKQKQKQEQEAKPEQEQKEVSQGNTSGG